MAVPSAFTEVREYSSRSMPASQRSAGVHSCTGACFTLKILNGSVVSLHLGGAACRDMGMWHAGLLYLSREMASVAGRARILVHWSISQQDSKGPTSGTLLPLVVKGDDGPRFGCKHPAAAFPISCTIQPV